MRVSPALEEHTGGNALLEALSSASEFALGQKVCQDGSHLLLSTSAAKGPYPTRADTTPDQDTADAKKQNAEKTRKEAYNKQARTEPYQGRVEPHRDLWSACSLNGKQAPFRVTRALPQRAVRTFSLNFAPGMPIARDPRTQRRRGVSRHLGHIATGTYGTMAWIVCNLYLAKATFAIRLLPVLGPMSQTLPSAPSAATHYLGRDLTAQGGTGVTKRHLNDPPTSLDVASTV